VIGLGRRRGHKTRPPAGGCLEPNPAFVLHGPTVQRASPKAMGRANRMAMTRIQTSDSGADKTRVHRPGQGGNQGLKKWIKAKKQSEELKRVNSTEPSITLGIGCR
jgi:hypothetical protein